MKHQTRIGLATALLTLLPSAFAHPSTGDSYTDQTVDILSIGPDIYSFAYGDPFHYFQIYGDAAGSSTAQTDGQTFFDTSVSASAFQVDGTNEGYGEWEMYFANFGSQTE